MRQWVLAAAIAAMLPAAANAAISVKFWANTTPTGVFTPTGAGPLIDFETYDPSTGALNDGFTLSGANGWTIQNVANGNGAKPMTAGGPDDTNYLTVYGPDPDDLGEAYAKVVGTRGYTQASFYWGSIDTYNEFYLLDASGARISPRLNYQSVNAGQWDGNQSAPGSNGRVTITSTDAFHGIEFSNVGSPAFEVDNLKFSSAMPEPASWAMMLVGFGGIGTAMRRRPRGRTVRAVA